MSKFPNPIKLVGLSGETVVSSEPTTTEPAEIADLLSAEQRAWLPYYAATLVDYDAIISSLQLEAQPSNRKDDYELAA